jgi:drug/metabolite transporter (DMT)-like permease
MKKNLIHGVIAGMLAGIACIIYNNTYSQALVVDYSKVVNIGGLIISCVLGCLLASVGYIYLPKIIKNKVEPIFNVIFVVLTFASFVGPFAATLPTNIDAPELFIGLTIPMHLFPIIFWLAIKPFFKDIKKEDYLTGQ